MTKTRDYIAINKAFEKAVHTLQDNLQYLVDNDKVSERFVALQNGIIKALILFQNRTEEIISDLEMENLQLTKRKLEHHENLKDAIWSLEAICIIHGILDFPMWMARGKNHLIEEAKETYHDGAMFLPSKLKERLDSLPSWEQATIKNILYKRYDEEIEEIEKRIKELRKRKQDGLNA